MKTMNITTEDIIALLEKKIKEAKTPKEREKWSLWLKWERWTEKRKKEMREATQFEVTKNFLVADSYKYSYKYQN